jgi:DNA-3-methyladenine glycosylase II
VFPGDDVGARNNLHRLLGPEAGEDYASVRRAVSPWAPFTGLVYFHLLLDGLDRAGLLADREVAVADTAHDSLMASPR